MTYTLAAQAPYDWDVYERELGLFHHDGTPKPVLGEIGKFGRFINSLPIPALRPRKTEPMRKRATKVH